MMLSKGDLHRAKDNETKKSNTAKVCESSPSADRSIVVLVIWLMKPVICFRDANRHITIRKTRVGMPRLVFS
jgi:hypothetical protein